ncbi:sensor histidine kinase [Roseomonas populi]|uniref:histidine kinase n=1 Tax=Roseomonas populi TaxID=3121582 RepID=A0ABT1X3Q2_9PROT|nr:HAMP domain-containing histidine kinase [Roseomonas pecuniae]MCR0982707.1 HAMP domain-containing histidine kinase [Roseomonas pecuniae]
MSRFLTIHMLERDAAVSGEFIESIVRAEGTWSYFDNPASAGSRPALESIFSHVARLPGVVRANIYSSDGIVLWSSNPDLIGRRFTDNHELDRALGGEMIVESGTVETRPKTEHQLLDSETGGSRFMEAYLPVQDDTTKRVVGVVEIYRLPLALFAAIDKGTRLVWLSALAGAALLYAALTGLICRAECTLRYQQERLVEAETLAAVGAVASAVAHGIRNPLASIRSSAELAALEDDWDLVRGSLADIEREADRVEGWIRELLLTARGDAVAPVAVDIPALLAEAERRFAVKAERQGVRLTVRTEAVPPARGNSGPLGQALDSLVANGIEAMPDGGELRLEVRPAEGGRMVEIRICDTGAGLPELLARGRNTLFFSTKPRGTGLGLVLARRIVGLYDGTLELKKGPGGQGTRATITLPAAA